MRNFLNTIVLYIYKLCCKYLDKHLYIPKHADHEFWRDKNYWNGDDFN